MHPHIERYLKQVERQFKGLTSEQREAELREIGQHIQAIVDESEQQGLCHAEAVREALRQFGAPHKVGRELQRASSRRLPLWLSLITNLMMAQAALNVVGTCTFIVLLNIQGIRSSSFPWFSGLHFSIIQYGVIVMALGLRRLKPKVFWLVVTYQFLALNLSITRIWPLLGKSEHHDGQIIAFILTSLHIFYLFVLIAQRKSYMKLTHAK